MNPVWKRLVSWVVVVIGLLMVALSYYSIWVLVAYFAAGLIWFAEIALLVSGPTSGIGALFAYQQPRQKMAMTFGLLGLIGWILLWVFCFTVLGFRFG